MDFTLKHYKRLLNSFKQVGFTFQTFNEYTLQAQNVPNTSIRNTDLHPFSWKKNFTASIATTKVVVLRHDVDKLPQNSLQFARIQASIGIKGSYYFRIIPKSFNEKIILEIASMGHEIGYHYENMDSCKGDIDKAFTEFRNNLEVFRKLAPISTICMHGSPRSPYDNRDIWNKYNYHDLGITGEPYFDIDFNKVAYYTDTGRMWDGVKYSVRDKPLYTSIKDSIRESKISSEEFMKVFKSPFPIFHSTDQIINSIHSNSFPYQVMLTFHPQRWTTNPIAWTKELLSQSLKNLVKRFFFVGRNQLHSFEITPS